MKLHRTVVPGLSHFYSTEKLKKLAQKKKLLNVDLETCTNCNWRCKYCYLSEHEKLPSKDTLKKVLDKIAQANPENVTFTGGEPLMRTDIAELFRYATAELGLSVSVFTNGSKIDESMACELANSEIGICLKMDSLKADTQDYLTGIKGSHVLIMTAIENLKKVGYTRNLPLSVHSAITSRNLGDIPDVWRWANKQKITPHCTRLILHGQAKQHSYLNPPTGSLEALFQSLGNIDGKKFSVPFPNGIGCTKMYTSCYVNSSGQVQPCSNVPISAGNILQSDLRCILDSGIFRIVRNIDQHIKGKCSSCDQKEICYGCRGLALAVTGDYLAEDPHCWKSRNERTITVCHGVVQCELQGVA